MQLKGKAPVNPQTLRVVLPRAQEATLSNGLRVALLEDHKLPTFSLQLLLTGGGLDDPADQHGLAMVTASLLREGTAQRTSRQIAEQLATLGGAFSAGASPSSGETAISIGGLSENADPILAIAADVVRNPAFPEAELDKVQVAIPVPAAAAARDTRISSRRKNSCAPCTARIPAATSCRRRRCCAA